MSLEDLKRTSDVKPVENEIIVDDAEKLETIRLESLDFIVANHVGEHCQNLMRTIEIWLSRLKKGGIIYAALPERPQTFDRNRQNTTWEHILGEYCNGAELNQAEHYREYFSIVDGTQGQELLDRIQTGIRENVNIHFHCFDRQTQHEIFIRMAPMLGFEILEAADHGAEIIWVLRKL